MLQRPGQAKAGDELGELIFQPEGFLNDLELFK